MQFANYITNPFSLKIAEIMKIGRHNFDVELYIDRISL